MQAIAPRRLQSLFAEESSNCDLVEPRVVFGNSSFSGCSPAVPNLTLSRCQRAAHSNEEAPLRRHFSTFPDGLPGVGLLILRVAIGAILAIEGIFNLTRSPEVGAREWTIAFIAMLAAVSLLLGLYTTITASSVIIGAIAAASSLLSLSPFSIFNPSRILICVIGISVALILIGPCAFSVDAKIFGRREIIIPRKTVR